MMGRNKNWSGQSDWIKEPLIKNITQGIHEDDEKKKSKKKNKKQKNHPTKYKIFRQQD